MAGFVDNTLELRSELTAGSSPVGHFDTLSSELKVHIMGLLPVADLARLRTVSKHTKQVLETNFPTLVTAVWKKHPQTVRNAELEHILHRCIILRGPGARPFHSAAPGAWENWLCVFGHRNQLPPPAVPTLPSSLGYLDRLLDAIDWWAAKFAALIAEMSSRGVDNDELSDAEAYRIRRALLLFHLYGSLFCQLDSDPDFGRCGRVREQVEFLQSIHPHLVGELDGTYAMIEAVVFEKLRLCPCHVGRTAVALKPCEDRRVEARGAPGLELLYSRGLVYLKEKLDVAQPLQSDFTDVYRCVGHCPSRFFNIALGKCWEYDSPLWSEDYHITGYAQATPLRPHVWAGAPEGTGDASFPWTKSHARLVGELFSSDDQELADLQWDLGQVAQEDSSNCHGLVFWDRARLADCVGYLGSVHGLDFDLPCFEDDAGFQARIDQ